MNEERVIVRQAVEADAAEIARVHVAAWRAAYKDLLPAELLANLSEERRREWWGQMLEANLPENGMFVAEVDQALVGFVLVWPAREVDPKQNWGEVSAIYLLESEWGKGTGWRLWQAADDFLKAADYETIMLWVLDGNERAIQFYEKIGFVQDSSPQGVKLEQLGDVTVRELRYLRNR